MFGRRGSGSSTRSTPFWTDAARSPSTPATSAYSSKDSPEKQLSTAAAASSQNFQGRRLTFGVESAEYGDSGSVGSSSHSPTLSSSPLTTHDLREDLFAGAYSETRSGSPASIQRPFCRPEWFGNSDIHSGSGQEAHTDELSQRLKALEASEPLLRDEGNDRFVLFPIKYPMVRSNVRS